MLVPLQIAITWQCGIKIVAVFTARYGVIEDFCRKRSLIEC
jgi:hypothetical protein